MVSGALIVFAFFGAVVFVFLLVQFALFRDDDRPGPISPGGNRVMVHLRDRGLGVGDDFYTDIEILDRQGRSIALWEDPDGQQGNDESQSVIDSIRWISDSSIQFRTEMQGVVTFSIDKAQGEQDGERKSPALRASP